MIDTCLNGHDVLYHQKNFRMHIELAIIVKICIRSPKRLGTNKFVRTNFPKHLWGYYAREGFQLCTYIAVFRCDVRWRHSKPPNSGPHYCSIFYQFEEG